ncbi:MAG: gas vesicle protein [Comamonadaceae bacterium]|jgi:Gas vesicle protein
MALPQDNPASLCELLDRVLNTGVVAMGEIVISVAGIDLIYLNLNLLLTSVETALQQGRLMQENK